MDARITKAELASTPSIRTAHLSEIETLRLQAMRARDEALANWLRRGFNAIARAVISYPQRRRVYEELAVLSDRELSDIGLTRGDIPRVFDGSFEEKARKAANSQAPARAAKAAA